LRNEQPGDGFFRFGDRFVVPEGAEYAIPETWVRSWTNAKRTSDPIPHLRLGRYIRFPWGSMELHEWLNRQLVSANGQGH